MVIIIVSPILQGVGADSAIGEGRKLTKCWFLGLLNSYWWLILKINAQPDFLLEAMEK